MTYAGATTEILKIACETRLQDFAEKLSELTGRVVQDGPFKGMILPAHIAWGTGDVCPKILGCYEQELHVAIETCIARKPEFVVNVGCAEGYYAVGLGRRLPEAEVYAFDTSLVARKCCNEAAALNNLKTPLILGGEFNAGSIYEIPRFGPGVHGLYVIDIEGDEVKVLTKDNAKYLRNCDLIVEIHSFKDPSIAEKLTELLAPTHEIEVIRESGRDPAGMAILENVGSFERFLMVNEWRPGPRFSWLLAKSRA